MSSSPGVYLDADVAYLAGMLVARGVLEDHDPEKRIHIGFPFRSLRAEGIQSNYSQDDAVELSVYRIRERLGNPLNTEMSVIREKNACSLSARYGGETFAWKNLRRMFGDALTYREMTVPPEVMGSSDLTISSEFLRGFADAAGFIRKSNAYHGHHRVYLEVNNANWIVPVQLCELLQQRVGASVQTIQWGHPNTRTPKRPKSKGWAKEHQVKIYAREFLKVGFDAPHKQRILEELSSASDQRFRANPCDPYLKRKRTPKPDHPGESDSRLPRALRNRHFDSYWEICLALGCQQFKDTTGARRGLQARLEIPRKRKKRKGTRK